MISWTEKVRSIRYRRGWSTKELAAQVGVSYRTVEDWEQGRRTPSGPAQKILQMINAASPRPEQDPP